MSCTPCMSSSRTALRRVFLASALEPSSSSRLRVLTVPSLPRPPTLTRNPRFFTGIRDPRAPNDPAPSPSSRPRLNPRDPLIYPSVQAPTRDSRSVKAHNQKGSKQDKGPPALPRDDDIRRIADQVVLRREDGVLTEPRPLSSVLTEAHIRDQTVVTIVVPRPGQTKGSRYPICVVLDRAEYEASEEQRLMEEAEKDMGEKKAKKGGKELEINWAIDKHDLGIKMKKMREFLNKGLRVDILLLRKSKKKGRQATKEEIEETLRVVKEEAANIQGTRETKPPSGELGEKYHLHYEGPQQR